MLLGIFGTIFITAGDAILKTVQLCFKAFSRYNKPHDEEQYLINK